MNIFFSQGTQPDAPLQGHQLRRVFLGAEPPERTCLVDILSVRYRIGEGGKVKIQKCLPGRDSLPHPRFLAYVQDETLCLEQDGQIYAMDLPLVRSLKPGKWRRLFRKAGTRPGKSTLTFCRYYTLSFVSGGQDWQLLLPQWSLRPLCDLVGWTVTDRGEVELANSGLRFFIHGINRCGGCM